MLKEAGTPEPSQGSAHQESDGWHKSDVEEIAFPSIVPDAPYLKTTTRADVAKSGIHATLPPSWPMSDAPIAPQTAEAVAATPLAATSGTSASEDGILDEVSVAEDSWLSQEDYWNTSTFIAITGKRRAAPRPDTRPLPRPQRFRPPSRVRSISAFIALIVVLFALIFGSGIVYRDTVALTNKYLHPTAQPTTTPNVSPTATPITKK